MPKSTPPANISKTKDLLLKEMLLAELIRLNNNLEQKQHPQDYVLEVKKRIHEWQKRSMDIEKELRAQSKKAAEAIAKRLGLDTK